MAHSSFAAVQNQPVFGHGDVLDRHGASVAAWRADNDCTWFTGVSVHDEALEFADWLSRVAANRQSLQGECQTSLYRGNDNPVPRPAAGQSWRTSLAPSSVRAGGESCRQVRRFKAPGWA